MLFSHLFSCLFIFTIYLQLFKYRQFRQNSMYFSFSICHIKHGACQIDGHPLPENLIMNKYKNIKRVWKKNLIYCLVYLKRKIYKEIFWNNVNRYIRDCGTYSGESKNSLFFDTIWKIAFSLKRRDSTELRKCDDFGGGDSYNDTTIMVIVVIIITYSVY